MVSSIFQTDLFDPFVQLFDIKYSYLTNNLYTIIWFTVSIPIYYYLFAHGYMISIKFGFFV